MREEGCPPPLRSRQLVCASRVLMNCGGEGLVSCGRVFMLIVFLISACLLTERRLCASACRATSSCSLDRIGLLLLLTIAVLSLGVVWSGVSRRAWTAW